MAPPVEAWNNVLHIAALAGASDASSANDVADLLAAPSTAFVSPFAALASVSVVDSAPSPPPPALAAVAVAPCSSSSSAASTSTSSTAVSTDASALAPSSSSSRVPPVPASPRPAIRRSFLSRVRPTPPSPDSTMTRATTVIYRAQPNNVHGTTMRSELTPAPPTEATCSRCGHKIPSHAVFVPPPASVRPKLYACGCCDRYFPKRETVGKKDALRCIHCLQLPPRQTTKTAGAVDADAARRRRSPSVNRKSISKSNPPKTVTRSVSQPKTEDATEACCVRCSGRLRPPLQPTKPLESETSTPLAQFCTCCFRALPASAFAAETKTKYPLCESCFSPSPTNVHGARVEAQAYLHSLTAITKYRDSVAMSRARVALLSENARRGVKFRLCASGNERTVDELDTCRRVLMDKFEDDVSSSRDWNRCDHAVVMNLIKMTSRLETAYKALSEELEGLVRTAPGAPPPLHRKKANRMGETPLELLPMYEKSVEFWKRWHEKTEFLLAAKHSTTLRCPAPAPQRAQQKSKASVKQTPKQPTTSSSTPVRRNDVVQQNKSSSKENKPHQRSVDSNRQRSSSRDQFSQIKRERSHSTHRMRSPSHSRHRRHHSPPRQQSRSRPKQALLNASSSHRARSRSRDRRDAKYTGQSRRSHSPRRSKSPARSSSTRGDRERSSYRRSRSRSRSRSRDHSRSFIERRYR